jgi:hypothetical protein
MQLVLGNYTNLQLHVSHGTKFYLQMIVAKPKISSSASRGMSRVFTFMLALSPRLAKWFYFCKCLPFLYYTLVLSLLLFGVSFGFSVTSFWGCLKLVSCAFVCFLGSFEPSRTRSNKLFAYPLTKLCKIQWDESIFFLLLLLSHWCLCYI